MKTKAGLWVLFASLCMSAVACGGTDVVLDEDGEVSEEALSRRALRLDKDDAGRKISVELGQSIILSLPQNASNGYLWLIEDEGGLGQPKTTMTNVDSSRPGSSSTRVFTWKTKGKVGNFTVKLQLQRPWAERVAPIERLTYKFSIGTGQSAVEIGEDDDGKTIKGKIGQDVIVSLPANPTTGYNWMVKSVDRTLGYPEIKFTPAQESGPVGSGGTTTLTWKTTGPLDLTGSHPVVLIYQRPWAETAPPAKTFTFELKLSK